MSITKRVNKSNEELEFRVDGSIWKNGKLIAERLTQDQEEWVNRKMNGSRKSWETWDQN